MKHELLNINGVEVMKLVDCEETRRVLLIHGLTNLSSKIPEHSISDGSTLHEVIESEG